MATICSAPGARQVGGDWVKVTGILGPCSEPHEYEPTSDDAEAVASADVVIENGANLDEWLDGLSANAGTEAAGVKASDRRATAPDRRRRLPGRPHIWHEPGAGQDDGRPRGGGSRRRRSQRPADLRPVHGRG